MGNKRSSTHVKTRKMKTMNCHPAVVGDTINRKSCYTRKVLNSIKNAYNKNNKESKILSNDGKDIYNKLSMNLKNCRDESCWLNQTSISERISLHNQSFTPNKPMEWKDNPVEWLSNFDILNVLKQYEEKHSDFKFIGPSPIDFDLIPRGGYKCVSQELCQFKLQNYNEMGIKKIGVIFNLDKHDESGSHWVSLFISIEDSLIYYFDSAANKMPHEIKKFVETVLSQSSNKKMKFITNIPHQHQYGDTECGMYSLYFIITMLNESMTMRKKINLFSKKHLNDKFIESFRGKYFN